MPPTSCVRFTTARKTPRRIREPRSFPLSRARYTKARLKKRDGCGKTVDRENVMIKVPGTTEGIPAFQQLISEGININVTLLFAQEVYEESCGGLYRRARTAMPRGGDVSKIASVASFFISRIDSLVDSHRRDANSRPRKIPRARAS